MREGKIRETLNQKLGKTSSRPSWSGSAVMEMLGEIHLVEGKKKHVATSEFIGVLNSCTFGFRIS